MDSLTEPMEVTVKTRYSQNEQEATVCPTENGEILVKFHKPQRAPAKMCIRDRSILRFNLYFFIILILITVNINS